jgi:hypothetical protein
MERDPSEDRWRRSGSIHLSLLRGGMWPTRLSQAGQANFYRGRSAVPNLARTPLSQGRGYFRTAHASGQIEEGPLSCALLAEMAGSGSRDRDGYGCGPSLANSRHQFSGDPRGSISDADHRDGASRRRHAGQRRELSSQEAIHRRPRDGVRQQPGPYMT